MSGVGVQFQVPSNKLRIQDFGLYKDQILASRLTLNWPKPAGSLFSTETANEKVSELGLPPDMVWVSIHPFWHCAPFRMPECTPAAAEKMTPSTFGAMMSAWESTVTHACGAWSG